MKGNVDAMLAEIKTRIRDQKRATRHGDWYLDITKTVPHEDGSVTVYYSERRVLVNQHGEPLRTRSGSFRRESSGRTEKQVIGR